MTDKQKLDFVKKWRHYQRLDYEIEYYYQNNPLYCEDLFEEKQKLIYILCKAADFYRNYNTWFSLYAPSNPEIYTLLVKSLIKNNDLS